MFKKSKSHDRLRNRQPARRTLFLFESMESRALLAGDLDNAFDADGWLAADFGTNYDTGRAVAVQADGKIVVGGSTGGAFNVPTDFALARYHANGSLDTSFGTSGRVTTDFAGNNGDEIHALAIQADGKILAVGHAVVGKNANKNGNVGVARYNTNGTLDTTFGDIQRGSTRTGKTTIDFGGNTDVGRDVAIDANGKIVIVGRGGTDSLNTTGKIILARLNANGTLDASFDGDGKVTTNITHAGDSANADDSAWALDIQTDGKIVVAGCTGTGFGGDGTANFALLRYNTNGSLDSTFGSGGIVETDDGAVDNYLFAVALQSDGKILAGGGTSGAGGVVARYSSTGALDATYDGDGLASVVGNVQSLLVQVDGKLIAAGHVNLSGTDDLFVARLLDSGAPDMSFGVGGTTVSPIGTGNDRAWDATLQSDGKIVLAGSIYSGSQSNALLARYQGDAPLLAAAAGSGAAKSSLLTSTSLASATAAASSRWAALGGDSAQMAAVQLRIADLPGLLLGTASGNVITLDRDAAGWGWFVDLTPLNDSEFALPGNQGEQNRIDLLSVVMHELGHVLGHDHETDGVMAESLSAGVRRTSSEPKGLPRGDQVFGHNAGLGDVGWLGAWLAEQFDSPQGRAKWRRRSV